jgi:VWFA-related protein
MSQHVRRRTFSAAVALLLLPVLPGAQQTPVPQRTPPLIRSQITAVPVDVRVIGRDGMPVTDLTVEDFTIFEDGVPQPIRHFSTQAFTADSDAPARPPEFRRAIEDTSATPNRRLFMIMLGRGRHQAVSKYIDALTEFVTKQALPQDQVALMAWNRATDFTNDHGLIARTLARHKERHERIELLLGEWFSGLRAVYGSPDIPPHIQKEIDAVFVEALALRPRNVSAAPTDDQTRRTRASQRAAEDIRRDEILKTFPDAGFLPDMESEVKASLSGMSFEEHVSMSSSAMQDVSGLYAAIDYLRYLEGEKHVVFLTERGIDVPLLPGNRDLASVASDARIALNIIKTGGTIGAAPPRFVMTPNGSTLVMNPVASSGAVFNRGFAVSDLKTVAEMTGGSLTTTARGPEAFKRLHQTLGFQYLLAYSPSRPATDGKFRNIQVKVRRPGVRVEYRRGYFASPRVVPLERRDFITFTRIRAAARYGRAIDHIAVSLAKPADGAVDPNMLDVEVKVDISKLWLPLKDGLRKGALDVAVYAGDAKQRPIGEALSRVDLSFSEVAYRRSLESGAWFVMRVPIRGTARHVKAVVYDYGADLVGSTVAEMPLLPRK